MSELTPNALKVLEGRYLKKDENGRTIETPEEMFRRVARTIADAERIYGVKEEEVRKVEDSFHDMMRNLDFLPNSPTLMNAGRELGQLAACFVLPVEDSMVSIFESLKNAALILQSGGGTGFSFSKLRPKRDKVMSTGGIASGPVSFMKVFNTATEVIKQGGARRGANMGILRVDHPDIIDFITVKREEGELANFNISVAVTDAFMESVQKDREYDLFNPRTGKVVGKQIARDVFEQIIRSAWETGDPGLIFIDRINRDNPTPHLGVIESTNPCGEQPLLPNEACVLGSINLARMVKEVQSSKFKVQSYNEKVSKLRTPNSEPHEIDYEKLGRTVSLCVRFLDNAIDANRYPIPQIETMHKGNRKIGLGVMGWADMLIKLEIPYDSEEALNLAREVMKFIRDKAREESERLSEKRGLFPNFKGSIYDREGMPRVRNATTTTIAPTGTLSIIANCSSGIEPLFAIYYTRHVMDTVLEEASPLFIKRAKEEGFYSDELMKKIAVKGTLRGIKEIPKAAKKLFVTAHDISPAFHIDMQAAFQEYTDNAVSKTINLPKKATKEDVKRAYLYAYSKGCKGITIYRYGTKRGPLQLEDVG
ncbi:MAG: adenosylcobalamin-dependent ribonucleoside-diphosphate reductase [Nitrospirae bacterium]|nr:adenosylcobalamin-dependent ribonucleoside-diphosphate reductase [Nitrospirota bacterium]